MRFPTAPRRALVLTAATLLAACSDAPLSEPLLPDVPHASTASSTGLSEPFDLLDATRWSVEAHPLGRGDFHPENVRVADSALNLTLPAGSYNGGEIRTLERFGYGSYEARMRLPYAPGSISAIFLYQGLAKSDEIDIEMYNDGSRRIMFTVWVAGRRTQTVTRTLPFDPAADFHSYRIVWDSNRLRFLVDGVMMQEWRNKLPRNPMYLMANAWWPTWLSGAVPSVDSALQIDEIRAAPL